MSAGDRPQPSREAARFRAGGRVVLASLALGLLGWIAIALGFVFTPNQMLFSYLSNYAYWAGLALGALCWLLVLHTAKSKWAVVVRRPLEVMAATIGLFLPLLVPVAAGMKRLYPWVRPSPERGAQFHWIVAHNRPYLNATGWVVRSLAFFSLWISCSRTSCSPGRAARTTPATCA